MRSWRLALTLILTTAASPLSAQVISGDLVSVNSDIERYLRVLQLRGVIPLEPWTIRELGPREVERLTPPDTGHPWSARLGRPLHERRTVELRWISPRVQAIYNSAFPFGYNDGAIWAGRGATTALEGGFVARAGPLTAVVSPIAFRAENQSFSLTPNGEFGDGLFRDPFAPGAIDLPQRFGHGPYQRIDPGQSVIRLDLAGVALGVSSANQHWGPAFDHPVVLGNNAAGFPHVFIGSSSAVDSWIGRLHARIEWGRLAQSRYSPHVGEERRFMSGIVASIMPRGASGLEVGGARFFHLEWPRDGLTSHDFLRPIEGILKTTVARQIDVEGGDEPDNQLATIFFRWTLPRSGFEVYGEFAREDHSVDTRDLTVEPDHDAAYGIGVQKVWARQTDSWWVIQAEQVNSRLNHLAPVRAQTAFYLHVPATQGHTERGQVLGGVGVLAGAASRISVERYFDGRKLGVRWLRMPTGSAGVATSNYLDVRGVLNEISASLDVGTRIGMLGAEAGLIHAAPRLGESGRINLRLRLGLVRASATAASPRPGQ
jgi:hypothetical protein